MTTKKILAVVLAVIMCCFAIVGCSSGTAAETAAETDSNSAETVESEEETAEEIAETSAEPIEFEVAFVSWGYSDELAIGYTNMLNAFCDGLMELEQPIKINWDWCEGVTYEETMTQVESMVQKGVDAVMTLHLATAMIDYLTENETYFCSWTVYEDEIEEYAAKSPYYVGTIHEQMETCHRDALEKVLESGADEIALMSPAPGNQQHDQIWPWWYEILEDYPEVIVHEYKGDDRNEAVKNFIALYPGLDAVIDTASGLGYGEGAVSAIRSEGKVGQITYSTSSGYSTTQEDFEDGLLVHLGDGYHPSVTAIFVVLLNELMGTPLSEEPIVINWPVMIMTSAEEYADYYEYCYDEEPITTAEYEPYFKWLHPDCNTDEFIALNENLTLQDIMTRHAH